MEQGHHDWSWLGPVAGAVGVGLGAAGAVIAGAWRFLSGKGGALASSGNDDLEKRMKAIELAVNTLEEQQRQSAGREENADKVRAEIFRELRSQGKQLAAIAGALGLPPGD